MKQNAPWVYGCGGARRERGMNTSGAIGEVYNQTSPNPQLNTDAQRSWLYSEDPMIEAKRRNMKQPPIEMICSVKGLGDQDGMAFNPDANFKRTSSITKYLDPKAATSSGNHVFKDEAEAII